MAVYEPGKPASRAFWHNHPVLSLFSTASGAAWRRPFAMEWILLAGGLFVVASFLAFSLDEERRVTDTREHERLTTQARVIHDNLARQLEGVNRALESVLDDLPLWQGQSSGMAHANRRLRAFTEAMPGVRTLIIMDEKGVAVAANRPELIGRNFRDRAYFQAAIRTPDPETLYVSPPFRTSLNVWAINAVRMVSGPDGKFAGVVTATLDPDAFATLLDSVRYAQDMRAGIIHGDGEIFLAAPPRPEIYGKNLSTPDSFFTRHKESGRDENTFQGVIRSTNEERIVTLRTINPAALKMDKVLIAAVSREQGAVHARWKSRARSDALLFALLALTSCTGLAVLQRRRRSAAEQMAQAEAALRKKDAAIDRFFSVSIDLFAISDIDGRFLKLNPAWERVLGYPVSELEGAHFIDLVHPDDREATLKVVPPLASGEMVSDFTNRCRAKNGEYRYIEWHSVAVPEESMIYGAARDVTEQYRTEEKLHELNARLLAQAELLQTQAYVDGLTGIPNRRRFDEAFIAEWRRCRREKVPLAVLMIDIDHFKHYNDHYGHQAGDATLKAVARVLQAGLGRSYDLVARYGGEEFVCIFPDSSLAGASAKAEALRATVEGLGIPHAGPSASGVVTLSIGVAVDTPGENSAAEMLLAVADKALYAAKNGGRNRVNVGQVASHFNRARGVRPDNLSQADDHQGVGPEPPHGKDS
ncbi:diguanylate cyclase [Thauera aromatica]|uniref:sensor domain-containing diguanylate cyclase n=1 Tax=Thauera aromatica TaxID=59405 RepID=UPI001FFCC2E4|nr:diguanylate cyclase [Thauera aromatica]MCK2088960.1 diguanylate cyclase [Thauera aromatica]